MFDIAEWDAAVAASDPAERIRADLVELGLENRDDWLGDALSARLVELLEVRERLDAELTRVGPGTAMGDLMRRYWLPVVFSHQLEEPDGPPQRARLLGEDLVVFRDTEGRVGLIDEACPHRTASMFFGRNEECGLRCVYHGIKFDVEGNCVDVPCLPPGTPETQIAAIKKNMAIKATPGALKHAEARLASRIEAEKKARADAEALASQLTGTRVVIAAQAGDEGKLFGSIQAADIVAGVEKFAGIALERKFINLEAPIKDIGLHEINVKLHPEVEFPLTIDVIPA